MSQYYILWVVLPFLLTCCASAYLTTLLCRFAKWRGWRAHDPFHLAGFFPWTWWSKIGKTDEGEFLRSVFIRVSAPALVPALFVVWHYRRRIRNAADAG
jgi:hypothetical protein